MSESMTRGTNTMTLRGAQIREDVGSIARMMMLPDGVDVDPIPLMVNHELFAGLMQMGVVTVEKQKNALKISTQTGLRALLPALPDPHREIELGLSSDEQSIDPGLYAEWFKAATTATQIVGRNATVFTYRKNVFCFTREAMVSVRLSKPWPLPTVTAAKHIARLQQETRDTRVVTANATTTELLIRTETRATIKVESEAQTMPLEPNNMLAAYKTHSMKSLSQLDAQAFRSVATQLMLAEQASAGFGRAISGASKFVEIAPGKNALHFQLGENEVCVDGVDWTFNRIQVPMTAFKLLAALPQDIVQLDVMVVPAATEVGPFILKMGDVSIFLVAQGRAT